MKQSLPHLRLYSDPSPTLHDFLRPCSVVCCPIPDPTPETIVPESRVEPGEPGSLDSTPSTERFTPSEFELHGTAWLRKLHRRRHPLNWPPLLLAASQSAPRKQLLPVRRWTAFLLLTCFVPACTGWNTQQAAPQDVVATKHPKVIKVTRSDGTKIQISSPNIEGDSLIGLRAGKAPRDSLGARVAIALSDISQVAVQQTDAAKTVVLTAGVGLAVLLAIVGASGWGNFGNSDSLMSSPLVYSWDGRNWRLDSGTFAGAITEAAARTDVDNLVYAATESGELRLKLTNELKETDYVDALAVLAVDHERDVGIAPDATGAVHTVGPLVSPLHATDFVGRDALEAVRSADGRSWESVATGRDTARAADIRDGVELVFLRPQGQDHPRLVVDGQNTAWVPEMLSEFVSMHGPATQAWYDSLDSRPAQVRQLATMMAREGFLTVSLWTAQGWVSQGYLPAPGPELSKRQVQVLDLSLIRGDTVRLRLESAPAFWLLDLVAIDFSPERSIHIDTLRPERAVDLGGRDVLPLISAVDGGHWKIETGDAAELRFSAPEIPAGAARSYLVETRGWYRIRAPAVGQPNVALMDRLLNEPGAASRYSVSRMNEFLAALAR